MLRGIYNKEEREREAKVKLELMMRRETELKERV
jgi:hypothetical protein